MLKTEEKLPVWSVGLMTGTVLDGNIDVALLKTDGETVSEFGVYELEPYDEKMVDLLKESLLVANEWQFQGAEPAIFNSVAQALTDQQAQAVLSVLKRHSISPEDIAVIGFHGQSVLHRPPQAGMPGQTRQLGNGQQMADTLGIPVAWDFRTADVAAGGQGAPLAPIYHRALLKSLFTYQNMPEQDHGSTAVLNLGGIGNVTWWGGEDRLVAFDTGPANAPINDWVQQHGYAAMDKDGKLAESGQVDEERLHKLLCHAYFSKPYSKSLDRYDFTADAAQGLDLADGAALLTAFSAGAVGLALDLLPQRPKRLILCGGGRRNPSLVREIAKRAVVETCQAEDAGWRGDAVEAECFAYLAVRSMRALPLSFPTTTGVPHACRGGVLSYPAETIRH